MPRNTRLKPYTTRMAKIQGLDEGKTYSTIYKEEWTQPWPMGSKIYPKVLENPKTFFINSSPILLEPLVHGSSNWSFPREDCINQFFK